MFNRVFHLMLIGVLMLPTIFVGCTEKDTTVNAVAEQHDGDASSQSLQHEGNIWPFSSEDPVTGVIYTGTLYTYGSRVGESYISRALEVDQVKIWEIYLIGQGFARVDNSCKYISTSAVVTEEMIGSMPWQVGDTISVEIMMLTFEQPTDDPLEESFATIKYTSLNDQMWDVQLTKIFYGDSHEAYWQDDQAIMTFIGYEELPDGSYGREVWTGAFRPTKWTYLVDNELSLSPLLSQESALGPDEWDWEQYWACVGVGISVGCALSAIACLFTGPAWLPCYGVGCGILSVMGSLIGCAISGLFFG
jgi:hypothetical protein